ILLAELYPITRQFAAACIGDVTPTLPRELNRPDDVPERARVGAVIIPRRDAKDVEERAVGEQRRVDVDHFLAAGQVGHVRRGRVHPLAATDRPAIVVPRRAETRIALAE